MAQFDFAEKIEIDELQIESTDVMTGDRNSFFTLSVKNEYVKSIFHYENAGEIYIGSSNISRGALTSSIEWNYRFNSLEDKKNFCLLYDTFVDLFGNHSNVIDDEELTRYSKNWHKPAVSKDLAKYDSLDDALRSPMI